MHRESPGRLRSAAASPAPQDPTAESVHEPGQTGEYALPRSIARCVRGVLRCDQTLEYRGPVQARYTRKRRRQPDARPLLAEVRAFAAWEKVADQTALDAHERDEFSKSRRGPLAASRWFSYLPHGSLVCGI